MIDNAPGAMLAAPALAKSARNNLFLYIHRCSHINIDFVIIKLNLDPERFLYLTRYVPSQPSKQPGITYFEPSLSNHLFRAISFDHSLPSGQ